MDAIEVSNEQMSNVIEAFRENRIPFSLTITESYEGEECPDLGDGE